MTDFNPSSLAKLRFGELKEALKSSDQTADPGKTAMDEAMTLQACFRALTDVSARIDMVAVAGREGDPDGIRKNQDMAHKIFSENRNATPEERVQALDAIQRAATNLTKQGYGQFSQPILGWVAAEIPSAGQPSRPTAGSAPSISPQPK